MLDQLYVKKIRTQKIRVAVVLLSFVGVMVWQKHFIITGFSHNIPLNGAIFLIFFFAAGLAIKDLYGLRNEQLAFEALREKYQDIQQNAEKSAEDPFWKHYRCLEKGTVYQKPDLLGHVYELVFEELLRTRHMRISVSTLQNLTAALSAAAAHRRSLLIYIAGLEVFLGLIGTFIGLMEMVESVGGIIGGVAGADASSSDAMKKLLTDLEAPLKGMSTGFSASLFGLGTSMCIGLIGRFVASATDAMIEAFEGWLAGIAQIENEKKDAAGMVAEDATFMAAPGVAAIISALRSTNHTFEKTADAVLKLADRRKEENEILMATAGQIERLTSEQDGMRRAITSLGGIRDEINGLRQLDYAQANRVVEGFAKIESAIEENRAVTQKGFEEVSAQESESMKQSRMSAEQVSRKIDEIVAQGARNHLDAADRLESLAQLQASLSRLLQTSQTQAGSKMDDLMSSLERLHAVTTDQQQQLSSTRGELSSGIRELQLRPDVSPQVQQMSVTMDSTMVKGLGEIANVLNTALGVLTQSMREIAVKQQDANTVITAMSETKELANEIRMLGKSIDGGLAHGFAEMSKSFEAVFMSYSELINRTGARDDVARSVVPANATARVEVQLSEAAKGAPPGPAKPANAVHENLAQVDKFYASAQSRLSDLLKSA
ncbi:MAG TPA: hypothetical protein PK812_10490 [Beijerinckiaceae bacterium]|nr:hypothetical protein [Beijerinckiaceae bacterium]